MKLITSVFLSIVEVQFFVHIFGVQQLGVENTTRMFRRGTTNSVADFKELVTCTTYVDKTKMIADFFENSAAREYQLITCPHKFGKTVNIDMMKRFVEGGVGKQRPQENYDLFHSSKQKFEILHLLNDSSSFYKDNFQRYAVLHASFKVTGVKSYEEMMNALRENFKTNFKPYEQLWRVEDDLEDTVIKALYELSRRIAMEYPFWKIFLFIDDYDDPIINAIENNYDVTRVMKFIDALFSTLFNPPVQNIQYALITGTLNILDRKKFHSIKHWDFLGHHHFVQYFGLTEDEIDGLIDDHNGNAEDKKLLKEYYEGYHMPLRSTRIYNPYSIASYLANRNPNDARLGLKNYWAETGDNSKFFESLQKNEMNKELVFELCALENVTFPLKQLWSIKDLEELRTITNKYATELTSVRVDLILSYLFYRGYLSREDGTDAFRVMYKDKLRTSMNLLGPLSEKNVILDKEGLRKKLLGLAF